MKSNKSIICFIITVCFSINGLFSESPKNLNLKDVAKIKQYAQNIQPAGHFIGHSDVYSNDCYQYTSDTDCNDRDHCRWDSDATGGSGECVQDDGPPECIQDCPGIEDLGPDSGLAESCAFFTSILDDNCTDDCGMEESMMFELMGFMCELYGYCTETLSGECDCEELFFMDDSLDYDDDTPECLSECGGVDDIDGDDPMQVCGFLEPIWEVSGSCADDCADDEAYMELDMIAYMCEGCYDAGVPIDTTCVDWFDFLDDHDPCGQCHDECGDDNNCHDFCEADECACDVDDLCCQCHDACEDDQSCHDGCDDNNDCAGDEGPPDCLSGCEGIDAIDPEENASDFCTWLTATGTDISSCSSGCDAELLTELDMMSWMCAGCLAEDPDGTMGTCEYWLDFKGDDPE